MTQRSPARGKAERANRRDDVLEAAAALFATRGYAATSIRDIAQQVGILSGSLYYHFASKEEILLEAHARGVKQVTDAVTQAIAGSDRDPWARISAACRAHLEVLLGRSPFSQVITPQFPSHFDGPVRETLLAQRRGYEALFRDLIERLDLPEGASHRYLRLALLGALNWAPTWYREDGEATPASIADAIVRVFRLPLAPEDLPPPGPPATER